MLTSRTLASQTHHPLLTRLCRTIIAMGLLVFLFSFAGAARSANAGSTTTYSGTINGAAYLVEVPANWNHTLVLYSHGYVTPGSPNPARDVGDPLTGAYLLAQGYALAGSSYSRTGYAIEQAFQDQTALLDWFEKNVGHPHRTIAWGHSLGGIISAGLVQKFPHRFDGALPMCGVLAGSVGTWNEALDGAFVFKTLLAPHSGLQVVNITNPTANLQLAEQILAVSQLTAQGRARLALSFAMTDLPGWFDPLTPEPAQTDFLTRELNQFLWAQQVDFPFSFALRAELEFRAGGNPSWNTNVNYRKQLERSINRDEVKALYQQAGLNLEQDLQILEGASRIAAAPNAVNYLVENITFNGQIHIPVLTLHTTGDGLVPVENEQAYARVVREAGNERFLRETFVHRAGHCTFTPAETLTAFQSLIRRLDTGQWGTIDPQVLNQNAAALGPGFNVFPAGNVLVPTAPAFIPYHPAPFLRPFDRLSKPIALNSFNQSNSLLVELEHYALKQDSPIAAQTA